MTAFPHPLDALAAWCTAQASGLRAAAIDCEIDTSPADGRDKASAWVTLSTDARLAALAVWDTGEAELDHVDVESGQVHSEHRFLQTEQDLVRALSGLVRWVRSAAP
ncbi:hypothetical protein ABZX93_15205 [Streptomyces sp. NPDC006632]|uniref:immunity protein TriTu family protein n=1 Tax=Streptomyces sp. NPDC006632 TaxID=3157182 RepID=UPI0033A460BE